jgi:hemoglobin
MNNTSPPDNDSSEAPTPATTPYEQIGGATGLQAVTAKFYHLMDTQPNYKALRAVHGPDLSRAQERLFWFLSGWLGGPALYIEKVGHPMLRARHLPFPIGEIERDQWVTCMYEAMMLEGIEETTRDTLAPHFYKTADWMRNKPEEASI